jgi:ComEC/Rec2-related protein
MHKIESGRPPWFKCFCGGHPLFAAALVAAASVAMADLHLTWGVCTAAVLGAVGTVFVGWRPGLAWLLCGWISIGSFVWRDQSRATAERELIAAPGGWMQADVLKDAQEKGPYWTAPARLSGGGKMGATVLWQGRGDPPVAGSVVTAHGNFGPLPEARNPGEFDRAAWLRKQGIAAVFHAEWDDTLETGRWAALGARIRHGFRDRVTAGLPQDSQEANVIRAVVIGEPPPDADALIAAFRNSGTLHVFSVSGLHVAMVGSIGWLLLSWAGVPRRQAVLFLLPLMFGYSWITGNSAPAVRSAWMAAVFLGAFVFRRRPDLLNALGAVLLGAMLWDGQLLFQAGVQLSYGVVAAIAVGSALTSRAFAAMAAPEPYLPNQLMTRWQAFCLKQRRNLAQSLGVSLAAALGSAPLTAFHFGLVTPISLLANLVLVPLVFLLLCIALAAVALSPIAPLSRTVNRLNGLVANASVSSARLFAAVPGGHFRVGRPVPPMLLVYDLPHGAGAACFTGGSDGAVLIDCGDRQSFKRSVMPSLRQLGIEPDAVVLSHPDGGHLGGGAPVWEAFPIQQALVPVALAHSPAFQSWIHEGPNAGVRIRQAMPSDSLGFPDGAKLEILHAPEPRAVNGIADERVAVFKLHWRGWKFLLTSDAGMGTEKKLLDAGIDLSADVIISGRHRTDLTLCDAFLNAVHPQVIIASNASFPAEEKLAPTQVAYWTSRGIQVLDQGVTGGVSARVGADGELRIVGFLSASPVTLTPHSQKSGP